MGLRPRTPARKSKACRKIWWVVQDFGASLASMATSSPMEVSTITSSDVSRVSPEVHKFQLTGILFFSAEKLLNFITNLSIGNLDIILGVAVLTHKRKEAIFRHIKL